MKIGTSFFPSAASGGMSSGKIGATGSIRSPSALCGIGCVGHGSSPSRSVWVGTGVSMIEWIGAPVSRFSR